MAVTTSEEAIAQKVVDQSKSTAHVDTGALKRSIYYTVARGGIVFRQLFYGQYNDNSKLIQNAERLMKGIPYTIEELDEEGNVVKQQRKVASGRATTSPDRRSSGGAGKNSSTNARKLAMRLMEKRAKDRENAEKVYNQENNRGPA